MPRWAADMSSVAPPDILLPSTPPAARGGDHGVHALAAAILPGAHSYSSISEKISGIVLTTRTARWWLIAFAACSVLTLVWFGAIGYLFYNGVGIWGLNVPVVWAFDITSYVWWIAIAMSGTFISAALHLTRQPWGASISRFAEAMTVFALAIAGMFPIIHLGRPWFFYWLAPYPNVMDLWPHWRSPLVWDFFRDIGLLAAVADVLVSGTDPGLRHLARSSARARRTNCVRHAGAGLARRGTTMATAPKRAATARRAGRAPGGFRAQRGWSGLCDRQYPGLALDHLPAIFCRGRHVFRLCHGDDHRRLAATRVRSG